MSEQEAEIALVAELVGTARRLAERGWCPATGGNFSVRTGDDALLITASGVDKHAVTGDDLICVRLDGTPASEGRPSAESRLHRAIYNADASIGAVLHVHTVADTVLSRLAGRALTLSGYEMQKSLAGVGDHAGAVSLPILDNSQDMTALAAALETRWRDAAPAHAFLVRGHGLYAWGETLAAARRHLEGWEFLLDCEIHRRLLERAQ